MGYVENACGAMSGKSDRAQRAAQALAATHAGAVAFSRTGDPDSGLFEDGVVVAVYGQVDASALQGMRLRARV